MNGLLAAEQAWKLWGTFTAVDIVLVCLLLISMALGFWTGFLWQALRIVGVVVSFWVTWAYYPVLADAFELGLGESTRRVVSMILLLLSMLLLCYFVSFLLRGVVDRIKPELPDRVLGAGFGLLKGALLAGVFASLVLQYAGQGSQVRWYVEQSAGARAMSECARSFLYLLPAKLRGSLDEGQDTSGE
ncbi:MAG: CvpA family protein [Planctomycetes bacterium]|nr:CvpA family protein [Planctomycetota bacterium]